MKQVSGLNKQETRDMDAFNTLISVVAKLRHPVSGCPWDLKQTHQTLKPYLLEESYEVLEAIDQFTNALNATSDNKANDGYSLHRPIQEDPLAEELGDVLLQVLLHAQIACDDGRFEIADVMELLSQKLIRRHPHVFDDVEATDSDTVVKNWEAIKAQEKKEKAQSESHRKNSNGFENPDKLESTDSILKDITLGQPALLRATQLSKRAVKHGFKWPNDQSLWDCVMSEFDEFKAEVDCDEPLRDKERLEDEMGDIFFATVSLANHYGVDPETAMARANAKFTKRFQSMEIMAETPLKELSFEAWDGLWKAAKNRV